MGLIGVGQDGMGDEKPLNEHHYGVGIIGGIMDGMLTLEGIRIFYPGEKEEIWRVMAGVDIESLYRRIEIDLK